jgi:hypothetical protein
MIPYANYKPLTFHDTARRFTDGNDSPRQPRRRQPPKDDRP